ncbi:unnamed protein product [Symbiodinium sp. CCMP2592]|nr:unnamed protein product [Symbiodinium sp. CCMP2592]
MACEQVGQVFDGLPIGPPGHPFLLTLSLDIVGSEPQSCLKVHGLTPRPGGSGYSDAGRPMQLQGNKATSPWASRTWHSSMQSAARATGTTRTSRPRSTPARGCPSSDLLHDCPSAFMEKLFWNIAVILQEASLNCSLDSLHRDALAQLIAGMKAEQLPSDPSECSTPFPWQIAAVYSDIASQLELVNPHVPGDPEGARAAASVLRAVYQALLTAASFLTHSMVSENLYLQCSLDGFYGSTATRLVHLARGAAASDQRSRTLGFHTQVKPSDWALGAAAAINSVCRSRRTQAPSLVSHRQCSKSSLQYSNSASGGSAGIGTGRTFFSANVTLQEFQTTDIASRPPSHSSDLQEPMIAGRANLCAHLRSILVQATLDGRLQEELGRVDTDFRPIDEESNKPNGISKSALPVGSFSSTGTVSQLYGHADQAHGGSAMSLRADSGMRNEDRVPSSPSSAAVQRSSTHEARSAASTEKQVSNHLLELGDLCDDTACAAVPVDHLEHANVSELCNAQDSRTPAWSQRQASPPAAQPTSQKLRPWEANSSHRADALIRHLGEVSRGQGTAGVERCLYADGVLPLSKESSPNERSVRMLAEEMTKERPSAGQTSSSRAYKATATTSSLLSLARAGRQDALQRKQAPQTAKDQQNARERQAGPDQAEKRPSPPEASVKLPQVQCRGSQKPNPSLAAGIYAQSFKKVSSNAADKHRLYRSSQSLPAIKVKQRSPPDLPERKWRPMC